ncbi:MAG: SDR family oxidoreductase [Bacilli bacterium]
MNFINKVAIITGGASGIGLATAIQLANKGADVVVADWNEKGADVIASLNNPKITFIKTDVSSEENIKQLFSETVDKFGHVDYAVANAGIGSGMPCHAETFEGWNRLISINLTGVFLTCKYAVSAMLNQGTKGAIVSTASILGLVGSPSAFSYSASKGGIVNMTKSMAIAYAKQNIRINAIAPGYVDTPILAEVPSEHLELIKAAHPIGRLGTADEIANAIIFLLSDEASFITGVTLPVDGGYTAQ